jgi:competence protein ComEA
MQLMKKIVYLVFSSFAILTACAVAPAGANASAARPPAAASSRLEKVDINTADQQTLETLPGVGPQTAKAIILARPFKSVGDLSRVTGIGDVKLKELRPLVIVSKATRPVAGPTDRMSSSAAIEPPRESAATQTSHNGPGPTDSSVTGRVNLNTASKDQLEALPEIGPVKAQAIIDARPFLKPEDVMRVKGVKHGTYDAIKDHITVR